MKKQIEIGYEICNVSWNHLEGYKEIWDKADFDTKEYIVNEIGKIVINKQKELLLNFLYETDKEIHPADAVKLVENYLEELD